jgi:predicted nucleic acid-binding protein
MVLVDTSVWIRFLAGREPYATGLDELLGRDEVTGHEMVFGELLIGDRGGRARLLDAYAQMQQVNTVAHDEVVEFVRNRRLFGRGLGWIDIHLLASAMVGQLPIWTADRQFAAVAADLRIAFKQIDA